jgi:hypothetical protein
MVTNSLDHRSKKANQEIFHRYDRLNSLWTEVEKYLTRDHIPCPVEITYRSYAPDEDHANHGWDCCNDLLGLQKIKGQWRVCHGFRDDRWPDADAGWTPIADCSGVVRSVCAKHVVALEKAIIESAESFIPVVDAAIAELEGFLIVPNPSELAEMLTERSRLNGRKL